VKPFVATFYYPSGDNVSAYEMVQFIRQDYFMTMVARLHTFDGSMTNATDVYYLTYAEPALTGTIHPVLVGSGGQVDAATATENAAAFNAAHEDDGYRAGLFSGSIVRSAQNIPALRHYRLVHESPTDVFSGEEFDVKYVKTFEYVEGARIQGSGIISIPLVTDTGRHFTYRQESINGEFIVPYSTTGNPYGVRAEGLYTIEGTGQTFDVPETAVMEGTVVN
jgi:dolichyl-diphosphooligosaccharide--protein glycosyltransferase